MDHMLSSKEGLMVQERTMCDLLKWGIVREKANKSPILKKIRQSKRVYNCLDYSSIKVDFWIRTP